MYNKPNGSNLMLDARRCCSVCSHPKGMWGVWGMGIQISFNIIFSDGFLKNVVNSYEQCHLFIYTNICLFVYVNNLQVKEKEKSSL